MYRSDGRHYFIDGRAEVTKEEFDAAFRPKPVIGEDTQPSGQTPGCWPMRSEAMAVHPAQVEAANERNRRHGIGTRYEPDGTAVIPDRGDRKRLLRLEGFRDNNGGYGD